MRVIGFSIQKISGEKKPSHSGKIEIKSSMNIDDIKEEKLEIAKNNGVRFDYTYTIEYSPDAAKISIKGSILMMDEKNEGKEILKAWKKKTIDDNLKIIIYNLILNKCNLKAFELEEDLGLPFHMPFPQISPQSQNTKESDNKTNYTG